MSASKEHRDHEVGVIPSNNDKDRPTVRRLAAEPRVAPIVELTAGWAAGCARKNQGSRLDSGHRQLELPDRDVEGVRRVLRRSLRADALVLVP